MLAIAACIVLAGLVAVAAPAQARRWLGYTFPGVAARPSVAVWILAHNVRALSGVLVLLMVAQLARPRTRQAPARSWAVGGRGASSRARSPPTCSSSAPRSAATGADGAGDLPHGPVELAAYSLAIALYLHDRRRALPAADGQGCLASVALLALAAALETWVSL